jgi:tRNA1(Val) A37 N6-methylase TrmN6
MSTQKPIHLLDKRLALRQPEGGFRPGLDSVMLAAACPAKAGDHILDLGCGVGSAGLCVLSRVDGTRLSGLDVQGEYIALAEDNAALNDMAERTRFLTGCISQFSETKFDHIICNPPFMEAGTHSPSPDESRAKANGHDGDATLEDWVKAAFNALKSGGSFTIIHRADMSDKIILALGKSFGATEIIPLWPKAGRPAKRVIIRTIKHRKSPATIHAGLILHQENGEYTPEAENILRHSQFLG